MLRVDVEVTESEEPMSLKASAALIQISISSDRLKRMLISFCLLVAFLTISGIAGDAQTRETKPFESLSTEEFSRLINSFSEEGGYFRSDNFTSNETAYLTIVDKLKELKASGGAYIGVGPEQNFTYIAKIRPQIAFIVDIRRQAVMQHLMYKAIFHSSSDRLQFLSMLFSRPLTGDNVPKAESPINEIMAYVGRTPADEKLYASNLDEISRIIENDFKFKLTESDKKSLAYVFTSFRDDGVDVSYRMDGYWGRNFPTFREIVEQPGLDGLPGNFLAIEEDFQYVRNMHQKNLIIPIVGNFAGKKALASVGQFLKSNGYTVTAYYTSNVEQYLFGGDVFDDFAENVKKLPINDKSLFIRSASGRFPHPARLMGHRASTLLQKITVFIKDFDQGLYQTYRDLVTTNYIGPDIR